MAIFDNRALLHAGTPPGPSLEAKRMMHRISKVGALVPQPTDISAGGGTVGAVAGGEAAKL